MGTARGDRSVQLVSCGPTSNAAATERGAAARAFDNDWPTESTQGARSYQARRELLLDEDVSTIVAKASTARAPTTLLASSAGLPTLHTATDRDFDAMSTYTCSSFRPTPALPAHLSGALHTPLSALAAHYSPPLSSGRALAEKNPLPGLDLRDMSPRFPYGKLNEDFSLGDVVSDTQSIAIGRCDLCTDPTGFIVIPGPHAKVHLRVQNTTDKGSMFGLKCNAMERIKATPTAGVIRPPGGTLSIHLCLNDNVNWPSLMGERWDKLAIDYHLCEDPTVTAFDKFTFFAERNSKYRVKFNVIYRTDAGPVHSY
ncbi:hypothetical protein PENTCL1PPCAC_30490 [Pristionchus entomophagus]|uniref:Major sperm protein n=1 Tax=Pristionchus entomophagus TaxID=358040 RepID=A0AAV5UPG3_9BILA|nr:hypothetical protein PENTCL1PPCAC_30490 [Pristionchus entomophagus]